jgi:hypothetical protein
MTQQNAAPHEVWRPVPGFVGLYEVSDLGRVRSLDRVVVRSDGRPRRFKGVVMAPHSMRTGYLQVSLGCAGARTCAYVHRLVAAAFIGSCPAGMEVCHNDGNPANNCVENLRYDTAANNHADKLAHGTSGRGELNAAAKLTTADVHTVRVLLKRKVPQSDIARRFGVTDGAIRKICRGKSWGWLAGAAACSTQSAGRS